MVEFAADKPCKILSLDGGGAKGFYTLGVLREIEGMVKRPLHETFDLIFGTSTGAIIAALLSLGRTVGNIADLYEQHVPTVMQKKSRQEKSEALAHLGDEVFSDLRFDDMKTSIGIVATRWLIERPMIRADRRRILREQSYSLCDSRCHHGSESATAPSSRGQCRSRRISSTETILVQ